MPCRARKSLAKALLPSSRAAAAVGPKMRWPAARKRSTTPATSGASGPTTVSATPSPVASRSSPSMSVAATSTLRHLASVAVPALPGATSTSVTRDDWASFQARGGSRPPEPMTSTFMGGTLDRRAGVWAILRVRPTGGESFRPAAAALLASDGLPDGAPDGFPAATDRGGAVARRRPGQRRVVELRAGLRPARARAVLHRPPALPPGPPPAAHAAYDRPRHRRRQRGDLAVPGLVHQPGLARRHRQPGRGGDRAWHGRPGGAVLDVVHRHRRHGDRLRREHAGAALQGARRGRPVPRRAGVLHDPRAEETLDGHHLRRGAAADLRAGLQQRARQCDGAGAG